MLSEEKRKQIIDLYFKDGYGYKRVAKAMEMPLSTVKSTILRYKQRFGLCCSSGESYENKQIKRKVREKKPETLTNERIVELEMQVDLLKNFMLEIERR